MYQDRLEAAMPDATLVPHTWLRHGNSDGLALIFPGAGYTVLGPVIHYPRLWALEHGYDALSVDYRFDNLASGESTIDHATACALAVWRAVEATGTYSHFMLIGKSLGTRAMARILDATPVLRAVPCVWLTPIFADDIMMDALTAYRPPSLFVAGTQDPAYIPERMRNAVASTDGHQLLVEGGDHSLEIDKHARSTVAVIPRLLDALDKFQATE